MIEEVGGRFVRAGFLTTVTLLLLLDHTSSCEGWQCKFQLDISRKSWGSIISRHLLQDLSLGYGGLDPFVRFLWILHDHVDTMLGRDVHDK